MRALAQHFGENEDLWGLTGLLHDLDYPATAENASRHGLDTAEMLTGQLPDEALTAIRAHNAEMNGAAGPASRFDYALRCGETVTGLISAAALMGSRLTHFLVDEFQDTSNEQWYALRPLVEEALSRGGSLTWVGDVKQSIYGWRGGEPELFDGVFDDAGLTALAPDGQRDNLPYNWRSRREIVQHNNGIFGPLAQPDMQIRRWL